MRITDVEWTVVALDENNTRPAGLAQLGKNNLLKQPPHCIKTHTHVRGGTVPCSSTD